MNREVKSAMDLVLDGHDLPSVEMQSAVGAIMDGACDEVDIAALLTALRMKGESVSEIAGAAQAMRDRATRIPTERIGLLDTCGTGGDGLHTFNISTATALVAAAAGVPVAKHGNRSVSSSSGSADVLEALGVNIQLTPDRVGQCIDELGIGFCFAPLIHGAMKHAVPVRRKLGFRSIFNLLGPLTNPAHAEFQLLGVNDQQSAAKIAQALHQLGSTRSLVVCGNSELDEVSLWGTTQVFTVTTDNVVESTWTAADFGLDECVPADLTVHSAVESAAVIRGILGGQAGAPRNIVLANTAAAIFTVRQTESMQAAVEVAAKAIDSGAARQLCEQLAEFTQRDK